MSELSIGPTSATTERYPSRRLLGRLAVLIGGVGALKFVGLLVELGPAQAPWGFLLVFVLPLAVGRVLLSVRPRIGAAVLGAIAAVAVVLSVVIVGSGRLEPYWADYALVFLGGPLALAAVVVALRVLREG